MATTKEQQLIYQRGYQKGYKAGAATRRTYIKQLEDQRYERVYLAVLTGVLANERGWTIGEEAARSPADHARVAKRIADAAMDELKK